VNRRAFLLGLVGVVTLSPLAASAEPAARRIGLLMTTTPVAASHIAAAFADGLRELGHVEGKDVVFEYRWAEGKPERFAEMAAELVRHKVDVIVASSQAPALAAQRATQTIPIVMVNATDPVEVGLVASLARPGGNVTSLIAMVPPSDAPNFLLCGVGEFGASFSCPAVSHRAFHQVEQRFPALLSTVRRIYVANPLRRRTSRRGC